MSALSIAVAVLAAGDARRDWCGSWRGHDIVVRNHLFSEILFIDGERVAEHGNGVNLSVTLSGEITESGVEVPVHVRIGPTRFYMGVSVEVFVDGESIGLRQGPIGSFDNERPASAIRAPADPRWNAASNLLDAVREASPESRVAADQAQMRLRALLEAVEKLSSAHDAHAVLDDSDGEGRAGLAEVKEEYENQIRALVRAIQRLHIATLRGTEPADAVQGLVSRLSAEAEVADPREALRQRARMAKAAKQRQ